MTSTQMHFGTTFHCYPFSTCLHHHHYHHHQMMILLKPMHLALSMMVSYDDDDEVSPFGDLPDPSDDEDSV